MGRSPYAVQHIWQDTPHELARRSVNIYGMQMLRLRKLAQGEPLNARELKLCPRGFSHFCQSMSRKLPWLQFERVLGDKWTVNDIPKLRAFVNGDLQ